METQNFKNYQIADITTSCNSLIDKLEKDICQETKQDIVLIAYQARQKEETKN